MHEYMPASIAASAYAAADLGYRGAGAFPEQQLSPEAIARLFAYGLAKDCGRTCAMVILAGAVARYNSNREDWDGGCSERELAVQALGAADDDATINKLTKEAGAIVSKHWHEIAAA